MSAFYDMPGQRGTVFKSFMDLASHYIHILYLHTLYIHILYIRICKWGIAPLTRLHLLAVQLM